MPRNILKVVLLVSLIITVLESKAKKKREQKHLNTLKLIAPTALRSTYSRYKNKLQRSSTLNSQWCWISTSGGPFKTRSKPLGGSKVDTAFHLYEINYMSTRESWALSGKSKLHSNSGSVALGQLNHIHKNGPYCFLLSGTQSSFTCSKLTMKASEQCSKSAQR